MLRHNLRHKRGWRGALQRTRMELGKSAESWLSAVASPNLPGRASLDQAAFSSTVHGAFFFAKTKKNGGCNARVPRRIPHLETSQISLKIYLQSVAFLLNYTLRIKKKPQF